MDNRLDTANERFMLWKSIFESKFPDSSNSEVGGSLIQAANDWMFDKDTMLSELFDQYVMLKTLKQL